MKISYDPQVDAAYIQIKKGKYDHTVPVSPNVFIDLDKQKRILGIEILDFKKETDFKGEADLQVKLTNLAKIRA